MLLLHEIFSIIYYLNNNLSQGYIFIGAKVQDLEFGVVGTDKGAGSKTFVASLVDGTDVFVPTGFIGAYGNGYSYSYNQDDKTITSNAMNLSNGSHSLTLRVTNLCFKKAK